MSKKSKERKIPVRFLLKEKNYNELKEKADKIGIPLASYIKIKISEEKNGI